MTTFAICPLGCKVNGYEASSTCESLIKAGFQEVDFKEQADIYLIFTCAVTNTAAAKSRQKINQAIKLNKDALICVIGCYVQIDAEQMQQNDDIDILIGSSGKDRIVPIIIAALKNKKKVMWVNDVSKQTPFEELKLQQDENHTRAYLKIQDGCNQFCSYCIIPYARGRERSLEPSKVIVNAKELSMHHHEVVLAGIHTGRYGKEYKVSLAQIIKQILNECPQIKRIRISSIEITEIDDELIDLMANDTRVAKHFHIPLQSGCDATLARMKRPYTTQMFYNRMEAIRNRVSNVSISTDLIVGFAGESEQEFSDSVAFLKKARFSFIHVFPFSLKAGTDAEHLDNQVDETTKKKRVKQCLTLSTSLYKAFKSHFINTELDVLVETTEDGYSYGHSSEYIPIKITGEFEKGSMIKVIGTHLIGEQLCAERKNNG